MALHGALSFDLNKEAGSHRWYGMPSSDQCTYVLCPEVNACASSPVLRSPPLSDRQPVRGLIIQISSFFLCPKITENVDLKNLGHAHWTVASEAIHTIVVHFLCGCGVCGGF